MDGESDCEAIRNLIADYCIQADAGNADAWSALFAPGAPLLIGGAEQAAGPEGLKTWFTTRDMPAVTHVAGNVRVGLSGLSAEGRADFIAVNDSLTIGAKGSYHASFTKAGGTWKIASWHIEVAQPRGQDRLGE